MSTQQLDQFTTGRSLTRRAVLGKAFNIGAAALAVGVAGKLTLSEARAATQYKTTTALNFRSGPGTSYSVIAVIPAGTIVAHTGASKNGFYEVGFNGTYGWVSASYLAPSSGGSPSMIGLGITTVTVNLRSGPSTSHQVLRVLAQGTLLERSGTVQNGFRYVNHLALAGWVADAYLKTTTDGPGGDPGQAPYDPNYATTTSALNLRAEPSTSAKILTVMPSGARVKVLDSYANGFRKVSYNGLIGWAATAFLN
ncbi:MAG: SH3 domain-containing protein [Chloroflexota bacterium]|nr:SH3 domain-containing protein [Chloroflexota bacterium]